MRGSRSLPRAWFGRHEGTVGAIVVLAIAAGTYLWVTRPRGFNLQNNATGGPPTQLAKFTNGEMYAFVWSADGKHLAFSRGQRKSDVVMISNFR